MSEKKFREQWCSEDFRISRLVGLHIAVEGLLRYLDLYLDSMLDGCHVPYLFRPFCVWIRHLVTNYLHGVSIVLVWLMEAQECRTTTFLEYLEELSFSANTTSLQYLHKLLCDLFQCYPQAFLNEVGPRSL